METVKAQADGGSMKVKSREDDASDEGKVGDIHPCQVGYFSKYLGKLFIECIPESFFFWIVTVRFGGPWIRHHLTHPKK